MTINQSHSPAAAFAHPVPPPTIVAGMAGEFYYRRRWRPAKVLAVRGQEALIEYQMGRSSGLRILWIPSLAEACDRDRPVRYDTLSAEWRACVAA